MLTSDKRIYRRMVCECLLGIQSMPSKLRTINVSASGIAFQLLENEFEFSKENMLIKISLSFFGVEYPDLGVLIKRIEQKDQKIIIAGVFTNLSEDTRSQINALVEADGGYDSTDAESKRKYFSEKTSW